VFESQFPADFICEAVDQTRGWFYSLLAISTFMSHEPCFKNVMVTGHILDENGQKMSKSKGNVVDTQAVVNRTGADPLRWYLCASSPIWLPTRFNVEHVVEVARKMLGTLRNVHSFFTLYANIDCFDPRTHAVTIDKRRPMDRWLVSKLNSLVAYVDSELAAYEVTRAARAIQDFVIDDLSNWYVRRSRRRYWRHEMNDDKASAYATLYETLETLARLIAPFLPFVADEIYRHLVPPVDDAAPPSVHLCDYPESDQALVDKDLETAMDGVIRCVTLVRAARNRARIKVKQPLAGVKLKFRDKVAGELLSDLLQHLKEEVNVKEIAIEDDISEFVSYEVLPRFDVLGPRLGEKVKDVKEQLADTDMAAIVRIENGSPIKVSVDGDEIELGPDELVVRKSEKQGYLFESDGANSIVLDASITPELLAEGYAREIVSGIQNLRKQSGFDVTDNVRIHIVGGDMTAKALGLFDEHIRSETLAVSIDQHLPDGKEPMELSVGEEKAAIVLEKV
jgi:isoleucyl-tRNA synthetase